MVAPNAARARRAIGAMFFFAFGGAWLALYVSRALNGESVAFGLVGLISAALFFLAYRRYQQNRSALLAATPTAKQRKADRIFNIVNVGQWVVILVASNVLVNLGLANWVIACIIFIVGLHFLPLAYVMNVRSHYVTGFALLLLAAIYPFASTSGPASPIGALGAGLILWASAIWALRKKEGEQNVRSA